MLWGTEIAYIDRWQGSHQGQYAVDLGIGLGTRLPVHCTAAGKALLARLPAAEQKDLIAKLKLTRRTPKTIVTKTALRAELERIVAEGGVAVEDEEFSAGRRAVAAEVANSEGRLVATVELAVPAEAYTSAELLEELGPEISTTAQHCLDTRPMTDYAPRTSRPCIPLCQQDPASHCVFRLFNVMQPRTDSFLVGCAMATALVAIGVRADRPMSCPRRVRWGDRGMDNWRSRGKRLEQSPVLWHRPR